MLQEGWDGTGIGLGLGLDWDSAGTGTELGLDWTGLGLGMGLGLDWDWADPGLGWAGLSPAALGQCQGKMSSSLSCRGNFPSISPSAGAAPGRSL